VHRTVAALNVDGLSSFDTVKSFQILGGELSSLGATLARVAEGRGAKLVAPTGEALRPDVYARSDQKAFAEAGIPAVLVNESLDSVHRDPREALAHAVAWTRDRYHSPADDLEQPIDWQAARQHAELLLAFAVALADAAEAPTWKPGTAYRAAQLRARAEGR
jgi:Zn-dependent M28 family amino/carboxypeptidase